MTFVVNVIQNVDSILEMAPHLTVEFEAQRQRFVAQFVEILSRNVNQLLTLETRNENNELVGFVIAENSLSDYVTINQAWSKPENPRAVIDEMFLRVVLWAAACGKTEIRAETKRSVDSLFRRFGFIERSVNVVYHLNSNVMSKVVQQLRENQHG